MSKTFIKRFLKRYYETENEPENRENLLKEIYAFVDIDRSGFIEQGDIEEYLRKTVTVDEFQCFDANFIDIMEQIEADINDQVRSKTELLMTKTNADGKMGFAEFQNCAELFLEA